MSSLQRIHAAVLASFPEPPTGDVDGPRVLWRLDEGVHTWLYVASPGRPDFSHIVDQAGWPASDQGWETNAYQPLLDRLEVGQRWRFRLTASPSHKVKVSDDEPDTKRRALLSVGSRERWLVDRCERLGFEVATALSETGADLGPDLTLTSSDVSRFRRGEAGGAGARPITISRTRYDGVLSVTDPDALRSALVRGIGPAKAYGCGLLTLAVT